MSGRAATPKDKSKVKKKRKLTKKQKAEQERKKEEERLNREQEEKQRLENERREIEERERRLREELDRRRQLEKERRDVEAKEVTQWERERGQILVAQVEEQREAREWKQYRACLPRPNAADEREINTFIRLWRENDRDNIWSTVTASTNHGIQTGAGSAEVAAASGNADATGVGAVGDTHEHVPEVIFDGASEPDEIEKQRKRYVKLAQGRHGGLAMELELVQQVNELLRELLVIECEAQETGDMEKVYSVRQKAIELLSLAQSRMDVVTADILQHADEYGNQRNEVKLSLKLPDIKFGLWVNLAKNPRLKTIDMPDLYLNADLPKSLALASVALRLTHMATDYVDVHAGEDASVEPDGKQGRTCLMSIGGVFSIDLLALPPPPKRVKGWTLRLVEAAAVPAPTPAPAAMHMSMPAQGTDGEAGEENDGGVGGSAAPVSVSTPMVMAMPTPMPMSTLAEETDTGTAAGLTLKRLPYPMVLPGGGGGGAGAGAGTLGEGEEGDGAGAGAGAVGAQGQGESLAAAQMAGLAMAGGQQFPPLRLQYRVESDLVFDRDHPVVASWNDTQKKWEIGDVHDVSFDRDSQLLTFHTQNLTKLSLVVPRYSQFPYDMWMLRPGEYGDCVFTISHIVRAKQDATGGSGSGSGGPGQGMTKSTSVHHIVQREVTEITICAEDGLAYVSRPPTVVPATTVVGSLSTPPASVIKASPLGALCHRETRMPVVALFRRLRTCGVNFIPDAALATHMSEVVAPKTAEVEQCIARDISLMAPGCAFAWSRWNRSRPNDKVVFRAKEALDASATICEDDDDWDLFVFESINCNLVRGKENDDVFSETMADGATAHANYVANAKQRYAPAVYERCRASSAHFGEAIRQLFDTIRPFSFVQ